MFFIVVLILVLIAILFVVGFLYISSIIATPPKGRSAELSLNNHPKSGRIVACIGDSLTHGNIGDCWVDSLRRVYPKDTFLNEGINGNVVWQVHQRIKSILDCKPDIVLLMIGSNDAMASFDKDSGKRYKNNNKLPEVPTFKSYQKLLLELIDSISEVSKIALCTIPPIGENKDSAINNHVKKYNEFIELTAKNKNITLLPVSRLLWADLSIRTYPFKSDYDPNPNPIIRRIYAGLVHHYIFKKSWDDVAKSKGQWLLFDQIHLGERGAKIVFNIAKKYISSI